MDQSWGTLAAIGVGFAIAYYFYRKSIRRGVIAVQWDGTRLVRPLHSEDVTLTFRGRNIAAITATEAVIWNAGTATIRGSEIVAHDPLRFEAETGAEILDGVVIQVVRPVNGITANPAPDRRSVTISFDFLDPGDGFRLGVLHTGERIAPLIKGTIRGLPQGVAHWGRVRSPVPTAQELISQRKRTHGKTNLADEVSARVYSHTPIVLRLVATLGIGMMLYGLLRIPVSTVLHSLLGQSVALATRPSWALAVGGLVYASFPLMVLWTGRRRFPRALATDSEFEMGEGAALPPSGR